MSLPVNNYADAILEFGDRVGVPEIGTYFISVEQSYRNDEASQHDGAKTVKLYKRITSDKETESQIIAILVTEFFQDSNRTSRDPSGQSEPFDNAYFANSQNELMALTDSFAHAQDPYVEVEV